MELTLMNKNFIHIVQIKFQKVSLHNQMQKLNIIQQIVILCTKVKNYLHKIQKKNKILQKKSQPHKNHLL